MMDREGLLVELVDDTGEPVGAGTVAHAHSPPGRLHRAFSVMLYDESGRTLLQRRAAGKTRFASRWSNACCGHPAPGQRLGAAAADRLAAELGVTATLTEVGVLMYHAGDPATGLVEREWDHVLVGRIRRDAVVVPDPAEVSDYEWVVPATLDAELATHPEDYTPWLPGVLRTAARLAR